MGSSDALSKLAHDAPSRQTATRRTLIYLHYSGRAIAMAVSARTGGRPRA